MKIKIIDEFSASISEEDAKSLMEYPEDLKDNGDPVEISFSKFNRRIVVLDLYMADGKMELRSSVPVEYWANVFNLEIES